MSKVIALPCSSSVPVSISSAPAPAPALVSYVVAKSTAVSSGVPSACSPKLISTSIPSTATSMPLNPTTAAASAVARTAVHVLVPAVILTTAKFTPVSARPIADLLTEPSASSNGPLIPTNADASVTASVSIETVTTEPSLSVTSRPVIDSNANAPRAKKKSPILISTVALKLSVRPSKSRGTVTASPAASRAPVSTGSTPLAASCTVSKLAAKSTTVSLSTLLSVPAPRLSAASISVTPAFSVPSIEAVTVPPVVLAAIHLRASSGSVVSGEMIAMPTVAPSRVTPVEPSPTSA